MTEGCGRIRRPRSAASVDAGPPPALITCCYWSVKFEYAFPLLKVWYVLAQEGVWQSWTEFVLVIASSRALYLDRREGGKYIFYSLVTHFKMS